MKKTIILLSIFLISLCNYAVATTIAFDHSYRKDTYTDAINDALALVAPQLKLDVTDINGTLGFTFSNIGPLTSVITAVYFDFDTIFTTPGYTQVQSAGVNFNNLISQNLPLGDQDGFSSNWAIKAASPPTTQGINYPTISGYEFLTIRFNYMTGKDFDDAISAIQAGDIRIGLHVQSITSAGGSSGSYSTTGQTPVPEPATMFLFGTGLSVLAALARRRKK